MTEQLSTKYPNLYSGFIALQNKIKQPDKSHKGVHGSKYADLSDVEKAIREANEESGAGIGFSQSVASTHDGKSIKLQVQTNIFHESGESIVIDGLPLDGGSNSQDAMKSLTYARRGSLMAAFGIAPKDEDDDGNDMTALQNYKNKEKDTVLAIQVKVKQLISSIGRDNDRIIDAAWASIGRARGNEYDLEKLQISQISGMYGALKYATAGNLAAADATIEEGNKK